MDKFDEEMERYSKKTEMKRWINFCRQSRIQSEPSFREHNHLENEKKKAKTGTNKSMKESRTWNRKSP